MTNGDARKEHSKRPLSERLHDEKTLEVLTKDVKEWLSDQKKYDMLRVDDPTPLKFQRVEFPQKKDLILGEIKARDEHGDIVGQIYYARNPCDTHLSLLAVRPDYVGKGYAAYMMREFINIQDKNCTNSTLEVTPFGIFGAEELGAEEWNRQLEFLKKFYMSFGYEEIGSRGTKESNIMVRRPICETGKNLKPECGDIDLSLLAELLEDVE